MMTAENRNEPMLSIVVTVVSGSDALRRCLTALQPQAAGVGAEIIVPYDEWSNDALGLATEFPLVRFVRVCDLGVAARADVSSHAHRLYDRRRAVGLAAARGEFVAMTEDHAVPAEDWCRQIVAAHVQPHAAIGGAIENGVDQPLNWVWYYCDFGRYGRPFAAGPREYASDVNVSYKREALESLRDVWRDAYHETTVHWALRQSGFTVWLDPRPVVSQHRPRMTVRQALRERLQWGRVFAETRRAHDPVWRTLAHVVGSPVLPLVLGVRMLRNMRRQHRSLRQIAMSLPWAAVLLSAWSLGELIGYLAGAPAPEPLSGRRAVAADAQHA